MCRRASHVLLFSSIAVLAVGVASATPNEALKVATPATWHVDNVAGTVYLEDGIDEDKEHDKAHTLLKSGLSALLSAPAGGKVLAGGVAVVVDVFFMKKVVDAHLAPRLRGRFEKPAPAILPEPSPVEAASHVGQAPLPPPVEPAFPVGQEPLPRAPLLGMRELVALGLVVLAVATRKIGHRARACRAAGDMQVVPSEQNVDAPSSPPLSPGRSTDEHTLDDREDRTEVPSEMTPTTPLNSQSLLDLESPFSTRHSVVGELPNFGIVRQRTGEPEGPLARQVGRKLSRELITSIGKAKNVGEPGFVRQRTKEINFAAQNCEAYSISTPWESEASEAPPFQMSKEFRNKEMMSFATLGASTEFHRISTPCTSRTGSPGEESESDASCSAFSRQTSDVVRNTKVEFFRMSTSTSVSEGVTVG